MFGRKRRTVNSETGTMVLAGDGRPVAASRPQSVTYDNRTNYWPFVIAGILLLLLSPWLIWTMGIHVFEATGLTGRQAEAAMANTVKVIAGIVLFMLFLHWLGRALLNDLFRHREQMKELEIEIEERRLEQARYIQVTAQQQLNASRVNSEDLRFAKLITAVMFDAYNYYSEHGEYKPNDPRPWSRRQAEKVVLAGEDKPVGFTLASQVRDWLTKYGAIKHDQININRYASLGDIQELLRQQFDVPIQVNKGLPNPSSPLRDNEGFVFTE